jgi:hypothetical protein
MGEWSLQRKLIWIQPYKTVHELASKPSRVRDHGTVKLSRH